jgi:RNA-binding protein 48
MRRYLVVRNVPSLGCGDELANLFGTYGPVEESVVTPSSPSSLSTIANSQSPPFGFPRCKPMDAEDCEPYTDVCFIKFSQVSNAR